MSRPDASRMLFRKKIVVEDRSEEIQRKLFTLLFRWGWICMNVFTRPHYGIRTDVREIKHIKTKEEFDQCSLEEFSSDELLNLEFDPE